MKALVLYDSRHSVTEKIAQAVVESLRTTMQVTVARIDKGDAIDVETVDVVVIGCPTHLGDMDIDSLLRFIPGDRIRNKRVAVFDTIPQGWHWFGGSAASRLTHRLNHEGAVLLLPPQSFSLSDASGGVNEHELWHASNWGRAIQEHLYLLPV